MSWMGRGSTSCHLYSGILADAPGPMWDVAHLMQRGKEVVSDKVALKAPTHI